MTTIADICITAHEDSMITPLELLEAFADSTPSWSFLEEDTRLYEATRGRPACILSHVSYDPFGTVDYAFAGVEDKENGSTRLTVIHPEQPQEISVSEQDRLVRDFLTAFGAYAQSVHAPVDIQTEEREISPRSSLSGI